MRSNKTGNKGFTLIELLIVIAIIGILAAVLIPNLMNARNVATQRSMQAHSTNVTTTATAWLVSDATRTGAEAVTAWTGCIAAKTLNSYGHTAAPSQVTACTVAEVDGQLQTTVTGPVAGVTYTFVNGRQTVP